MFYKPDRSSGREWRGVLLLLGVLWLAGMGQISHAQIDVFDLFFNDQTATGTLDRLTVNLPQSHLLSGPGDEDWAWFSPEPGLPYTIKVRQVGAGADPELWVYPEGPNKPGFKTDQGALGGDETWGRTRWPFTGRCWVRVRAAALAAGSAAYTLQVTCDTGANLGLATISGTKLGVTQREAQRLSLPQSVPLADGGTLAPLYSKSALECEADSFEPDAESALWLGGLGDPLSSLDQPWVRRWHELFPQNLSITRLGIAPPVQPARPLRLTIQLRAQATTLDLNDGETQWPEQTARDVPPGARPDRVTVYRWDAAAGDWAVFDARPKVTVDGDGDWLVQTKIDQFAFKQFSSDFFAAAVPGENAAAGWTAYE